MTIKNFIRWIPIINGAILISVLIENFIFMCLVAFVWGIIWGHVFNSYIVPLIEKSYYKEKTKEENEKT